MEAGTQVQIFTTGGTIDKVYFDQKSEYTVGEPVVTGILREANVTVDYRVKTLFHKDSLDLTEDDRAVIVERVRRARRKHVLITHGTDTMADTARALQQAVSGKVVVLVGSLNPARFKDSDAVFNIGFAMAAVQVLGPGVYIAMNGQVFPAGQVRKNRERNRFERVEP